MLNLNPSDLFQEVQAAEKYRNRHLKSVRRSIRRFVGNHWRDDVRGEPAPENIIYDFMAVMLPQLIFENPRVTVTAHRAVTQDEVAGWMQDYLNFWIQTDHIKDVIELVCIDMLFGFGVAGVCAYDDNGTLRPRIFRVAPESFVMDPQCKQAAQAKLLGHRYQLTRAELENDPTVDQDLVQRLQADDSTDYGGGEKPPLARTGDWQRRDLYTLYDLYLPDDGKVCTISQSRSGDGEWVRPPTEYIGHKSGPYVLFGVYPVPSNPFPMSPIMAMGDEEEELNAHATALAEEAASAKSLILVDSNVPGAKSRIEQAPTGSVLSIAGLTRDGVTTVNVGGANAARAQYVQLLRQRVDRYNGMSDSRRGLTSGATATEVNVAEAASDARTEFIHNKLRDGVKAAITRAAWFPFHRREAVQAISWIDRQTGQKREGIFYGGVHEGQEQQAWEQFSLEIEPYSMRRVDPAFKSAQANTVMQIAMAIAPAMRNFPEIDWRAVLQMLGEANNVPNLADKLLRQDVLAQMSAQQQAAGMPMPPGQAMPGSMAGAMPAGMPMNAGVRVTPNMPGGRPMRQPAGVR